MNRNRVVRSCGALLALAGGMAVWSTDPWTSARTMAFVVLVLGCWMVGLRERRPRVKR